MQRLPAVIIQTPNSDRFLPLFEVIGQSDLFEPILVSATMGYSLSGSHEGSIEGEVQRFGRELTQNERACAISHSKAREIIALSKHGGIVFEDDARILDLEYLERVTSAFLMKRSKFNSALGLLEYKDNFSGAERYITSPKYRRLLAETPLAVATVLTPLAACELIASAAGSSQTADWPRSECRFFILSQGCVRHGDSSSGSVIGETARRVAGMPPHPFSLSGLSFNVHRLLQKLDTYLISYYQSK